MKTKANIFFLLFFSLITSVKIPYLGIGFHNVLVPCTALVILIFYAKDLMAQLKKEWLLVSFQLLFIIFGFLSSALSGQRGLTMKYWSLYVIFISVYWAFKVLRGSEERRRKCDSAMMTFLVVSALWGIIDGVFFTPSVGMRTSGPFLHPNLFGGAMVLAILFSISRYNYGKKPPIITSLLLFIFITSLFLSGSRNSYICFTVSVPLLLLLKTKISLRILSKAFVLAGLLFITLFFISQGFRNQLTRTSHGLTDLMHLATDQNKKMTLKDGAIKDRALIWKETYRLFTLKPWLGHGPFLVAKTTVRWRVPDMELAHAHNIFLNILVDHGLVGLTIWLLMAFYFLTKKIFSAEGVIVGTILLSQLIDYFFHNIAFSCLALYFLSMLKNKDSREKLSD